MLKFKTSCAVLANLSSNFLNEVGLFLFRYFEVGLRVCDIVVNKYVRYLISWWVLVTTCLWRHPLWATHWRQSSLLSERSCASSQDRLISFRPRCMMSSQLFLGLPGLRFLLFVSQYMACFGNLLSSIRKTCHNHRSLLSLMVWFNVCSVIFSLMTFSFRTFHEMPCSVRRWNLIVVYVPHLILTSFVWQIGAIILHCGALLTSPAIYMTLLWAPDGCVCSSKSKHTGGFADFCLAVFITAAVAHQKAAQRAEIFICLKCRASYLYFCIIQSFENKTLHFPTFMYSPTLCFYFSSLRSLAASHWVKFPARQYRLRNPGRIT